MQNAKPVAIVTGAARGIGRAIAMRFAAAGSDIVLADVDMNSGVTYGEEQAEGTIAAIETLGANCLPFEGDLTRRETLERLVDAAVRRFGRVDTLVNNVGGGSLTPMERSTASAMRPDEVQATLDLNLMSMVHACQAVIPQMKSQGGGAIVNISSRSALDPAQRQAKLAAYGIAKTGVIQYTRYLAYEVGPMQIRVNCVAPAAIATARIQHTAKARGIGTADDLPGIPLRRFGTPEDVADVVEFLASPRSSYVTGQCLSVCGGAVLTPS